MNAKELEIIKKLFKIAVNQQKTIMKLAQAQETFDPLQDLTPDTRTKEEVAKEVQKNFPWLKQPGQKEVAPAPAAPTAPISSLDPALKQMLDKVAPVLRGNLYLTLEPGTRNIDARYNKVLNIIDDPVKQHNQIEALLHKAFPGYFVTLIGENNPRWVANY